MVGSDSEEIEVDEQVILATTGLDTNGLLLVADSQSGGSGNGNNGSPILPTTGDDPCIAWIILVEADPGGDDPGLGDAPGSNVGGVVPHTYSIF